MALGSSINIPARSVAGDQLLASELISGVDYQGIIVCDSAGNAVATATTTPAGTERGMITRPIVSGTQTVADGGGSLTVDAPVGTPVYARLSDGSAALIGQKAMAASVPVVVASDQSVIPISDNAGSLTVDSPVGTPVFTRLSDGSAALIGQKAMAASLPVTMASDQTAVRSDTPCAQEVNSFVERVTGSSTEAMLSMNTRVGIAAPGAAAAAIPITTSRGLRIVSIVITYLVITATTPPWISVRLRHNSAAGTIATTNHLVNAWQVGPPAVAVGTFSQVTVTLPEGGLDIPAIANAQAVGFSMVASTTTPGNASVSVSMVAHEYA